VPKFGKWKICERGDNLTMSCGESPSTNARGLGARNRHIALAAGTNQSPRGFENVEDDGVERERERERAL